MQRVASGGTGDSTASGIWHADAPRSRESPAKLTGGKALARLVQRLYYGANRGLGGGLRARLQQCGGGGSRRELRSTGCTCPALAAQAQSAAGLTAFQLPPTHGRRVLGAAAAMIV